MRMFVGVCVLLFMAAVGHVQEMTAGGSLHSQANWSALSSKIGVVDGKVDIATIKLNQMTKCNAKQMLYVPGPDADGDGCVGISSKPSALNIQTRTKTLCVRGGNHAVVSSCAAGEELLSCAGGPGDQYESGEFWVLEPDFKNRRCTGHANQPVCYDAYYYGQIVVTAICYKP